jgi:Flp pilus assembly pilin Flp
MKIQRSLATALRDDEAGATSVEYVVIVVLVVMFCLIAWVEFREEIEADSAEQHTSFGTPP